MITAEEARVLRPRAQLIDRIKDDIDRAIRNVAIAGRDTCEVTAHIPNFTAWATARAKPEPATTRPELDQLVEDLQDAGFTVEIHHGGGAVGRPFFRISWKA